MVTRIQFYSLITSGVVRFKTSPTLVWIAAICLGVGLSATMVTLLYWYPVAAVAMTAATVVLAYLIAKPFHATAFKLTIITLPFLSAFVIDVGGDLRVPYLLAITAFMLGLFQGQLRIPKPTIPILLLGAFVVYALLSTILALGFDYPDEVIASGIHTSQFRPLIQSGQLLLMVIFFYLTINFLTTGERLKQVCTLIFCSLGLVVVYGTYEIACAFTQCEFFNLNTATGDEFTRFAGNLTMRTSEINVPRARSLLPEPLNLGIYILFSLPFAIARLSFVKGRAARLLNFTVISLALFVFIFSWSRGSLVGGLVVLPLIIILARGTRARLIMVTGGAVAYLVVALVIFPALGANASLTSPITLVAQRIESVATLPNAALTNPAVDPTAAASIGRQYYFPVEIFLRHADFGVGLGNYPLAFSELTGEPLQAIGPFSLHLEVLTQFGIIGASLFYGFIVYVLWKLWRAIFRYRNHSLGPMAIASFLSIVGVMVASTALGGLTTESHLWVMLAIGLTIPYLMNNVPSDVSEESP